MTGNSAVPNVQPVLNENVPFDVFEDDSNKCEFTSPPLISNQIEILREAAKLDELIIGKASRLSTDKDTTDKIFVDNKNPTLRLSSFSERIRGSFTKVVGSLNRNSEDHSLTESMMNHQIFINNPESDGLLDADYESPSKSHQSKGQKENQMYAFL